MVALNSTVTIDHCKLWSESYDLVFGLRVEDDASCQMYYSLIANSEGSMRVALRHNTTQDVDIINCLFWKSTIPMVMHLGTGNLTIENSTLIGSGWERTTSPTVYRDSSAGTTLVKNSLVLPSVFCPKNTFSTGVTTENVIQADPRLKPFGRKGFIIPRVDDACNVSYAADLANLLQEYGYKGTVFVQAVEAGSYIDQIRSLIQGGIMEVGCHTYSHTNLTYDHALHFEYTGSDANPTVELDSSGVIHLRTDGSDNVDIDTTQPDADTLGEIISNYSGTNNWTITKSSTDGQNPDCISSHCKSETLATMAPTAAPCDIDFLKQPDCTSGNCSGLYKVEIYESRIDLTNLVNSAGDIIDPQTGQKYEAKTFVAPYDAGNNDVVEALRTSGYLGSAGLSGFGAFPYNVFKIDSAYIDDIIVDGDEEQTTKNAFLFAINVAMCGLPTAILSHNESQATMEEWRWVLNGFKRAQEAGYNVEVTSLQLAVEALKRLGTYDPSTGDVDIHWSMPSFRLRHDSPCIDAGIKLPIHDENWRDLAGNRIRYGTAPDIGCYEYKTWPRGAWGMLPWIGGRHKVQWTPYGE